MTDALLTAASKRWLGRDGIILKPQPAAIAEAEAAEAAPRRLIVGRARDFASPPPRESTVARWKDLEDEQICIVNVPIVTACLTANEQAAHYADGAVIYTSPTRCLFALENGCCAALVMDRIMLDRLK